MSFIYIQYTYLCKIGLESSCSSKSKSPMSMNEVWCWQAEWKHNLSRTSNEFTGVMKCNTAPFLTPSSVHVQDLKTSGIAFVKSSMSTCSSWSASYKTGDYFGALSLTDRCSSRRCPSNCSSHQNKVSPCFKYSISAKQILGAHEI